MPESLYNKLKPALIHAGVKGEIKTLWSELSAATADNSIYQIRPDMIISPIDVNDLVIVMRILNQSPFKSLAITARGGATGTNGQSLNTGIIIDFKTHMSQLLSLEKTLKEAVIQPGLVLEQLNQLLKPEGLFFAPHTSSGNRCTIGGMIATDASGKGSRIYGKTSDNIIALEILLANGEQHQLEPIPYNDLKKPKFSLLAKAEKICTQIAPKLKQKIPKLKRHFVGYDAINACQESCFDPVRLFTGAEGTLGLVTKAKIKLKSIPKYKRLVLIGYDSFLAALESARLLLKHEPTAIETIDDHIQTLAYQHGIADQLPKSLRTPLDNGQVPICNFVEYEGDDLNHIENKINALILDLKQEDSVVAYHISDSETEIESLWNIRKLSAGLLGKTKGKRTPIPFIEDCVVGSDNVAKFAMEFRALLDHEGVEYGMYGHVDVGCLHIRPALDMQDSEDQTRFKRISDSVYQLVEKYDGIFWGEHGKGIRGQYLPKFVGPDIYHSFAQIKKLFDPNNRMNPGKLVAPNGDENELYKIDQTPFRSFKLLDEHKQSDKFHDAFRCNGNAVCQSYSKTTAMCPSYKATGDMLHSPKGRADLLRHWRTLNQQDKTAAALIEPEVFSALEGCLGCKACSSKCPVQVDIPELKSRFYQHYFQHRTRSIKAFLLAHIEQIGLVGSKFPDAINLFAFNPVARYLIQKLMGLQNFPSFSSNLLKRAGIKIWNFELLQQIKIDDKSVLILSDLFNSSFDQQSLIDVNSALKVLGYTPYMVESKPAGKPFHVQGYRDKFITTANKFKQHLTQLNTLNCPIITLEPTHSDLLKQEYKSIDFNSQVLSVDEFLNQQIEQALTSDWPKLNNKKATPNTLLLHCTERSSEPNSGLRWNNIFKQLEIEVHIPALGCCGMAGSFGYEIKNKSISKKLYSFGWSEMSENKGKVTATGFSCRCQIKLLSKRNVRHPLSLLT